VVTDRYGFTNAFFDFPVCVEVLHFYSWIFYQNNVSNDIVITSSNQFRVWRRTTTGAKRGVYCICDRVGPYRLHESGFSADHCNQSARHSSIIRSTTSRDTCQCV